MTTHTHSTLEKEIKQEVGISLSVVHDNPYLGEMHMDAETESLVESIMQLLVKHEEERNNSEYIAFCECGDALERKDLYPSKATYYCMGCDKTYILIKNSKGEEKHIHKQGNICKGCGKVV